MNVVSGQKQTISGVSMERSPLNFINLANPRLLYIFENMGSSFLLFRILPFTDGSVFLPP